MKPVAWTIAGSDTSGCAGIQADLKTFHRLGVHGASVITAITAQNTHEVTAIHLLSADQVQAQLQALMRDLPPQAVKIGMLGDVTLIESIENFANHYQGYLILDPVLISSSGKPLWQGSSENYLSALLNLLPAVSLLTPNLPEAELLLKREIKTHRDIEAAAKQFLALGAKNILLKGGHFAHDEWSQDYWSNGQEAAWFSNKRCPRLQYRGTGCTLSSAVTAFLALGHDIKDALVLAKMLIHQQIASAEIKQRPIAVLTHQGDFYQQPYLPYVTSQPLTDVPLAFPDCGKNRLGLYPVIDSYAWLEKLLPLGVNTLQLRIKDKSGLALQNEIQKSVLLAKQYQARLFINDHWSLALECGAYGVHLGQEDINQADISRLRQAGLRLGISTHSEYEMARAHALQPSYMAFGPIYPTTSKVMPFSAQGIKRLSQVRQMLTYPLVAIGGIDAEQLPAVLATQVHGIALISAITKAKDPVGKTQQLLEMMCHDYTQS